MNYYRCKLQYKRDKKRFIMKNYTIYTLFRIILALLMFKQHGIGKWAGLGAEEIQFPAVLFFSAGFSLFLAAVTETICALAVAIGLFTRINAILVAITMFVAGFIYHSPFAGDFKEAESAIIYFICFTFIAFIGGGKFSLDKKINKKN